MHKAIDCILIHSYIYIDVPTHVHSRLSDQEHSFDFGITLFKGVFSMIHFNVISMICFEVDQGFWPYLQIGRSCPADDFCNLIFLFNQCTCSFLKIKAKTYTIVL